jgi:hypothetical protein
MTKSQKAVRLAAETGVNPRTARRWLEREKVAPGSSYALEVAARKLGIDQDAAATGTDG